MRKYPAIGQVFCCGGVTPAASALFKLSSGLTMAPTPERIAAYVEQADELFREASLQTDEARFQNGDWMSTHPFCPIRLRAAPF